MKSFKTVLMFLIIVNISLSGISGFSGDKANAEDAWKAEFDDICSRTNGAMSLTKEELTSLIERCDKLKTIIESLDESTKKVYLKRLEMCKNMFVFAVEVIESKEKN